MLLRLETVSLRLRFASPLLGLNGAMPGLMPCRPSVPEDMRACERLGIGGAWSDGEEFLRSEMLSIPLMLGRTGNLPPMPMPRLGGRGVSMLLSL